MRDLKPWMRSALVVLAGLAVQYGAWLLLGGIARWVGDWGVVALATGLGALTAARLAPAERLWHCAPLALGPLWVASLMFFLGASLWRVSRFFAVDVAALLLGAVLGALLAHASHTRTGSNEPWGTS
jgi:hypothetical protein